MFSEIIAILAHCWMKIDPSAQNGSTAPCTSTLSQWGANAHRDSLFSACFQVRHQIQVDLWNKITFMLILHVVYVFVRRDNAGRHFHISSSYNGCEGDIGWFMVIDTPSHDGCPNTDAREAKPYFLYSSLTTKQLYYSKCGISTQFTRTHFS
jgi:sugar phosphate permease